MKKRPTMAIGEVPEAVTVLSVSRIGKMTWPWNIYSPKPHGIPTLTPAASVQEASTRLHLRLTA